MAVVLDAVDGGISNTSTITSAGATPNGSNRLMLACATGRSAADDLKTGGSGGTSLTKLSTDVSLFFDTWFGNVWSIHQGPTGSTTGWVDFGSGTASAFSLVYLEGVDQTTPRTTAQTAGPTSSSTPSLAFTGLDASQITYAAVVAGNLPTAITGFTPNGSTTVQRSDFSAVDGERQSVTLWLSGTADGSGNVTLGGTFTGGVDVCDWYMYGFGINAASESGSTGTIAVTVANATSSASGTTTVVGTSAVTVANATSAFSGTTQVLGVSNTTLANATSSMSGTTSIISTMGALCANAIAAFTGTTTILGTISYTNTNATSSISGFPGEATITTILGRLALSIRMGI